MSHLQYVILGVSMIALSYVAEGPLGLMLGFGGGFLTGYNVVPLLLRR